MARTSKNYPRKRTACYNEALGSGEHSGARPHGETPNDCLGSTARVARALRVVGHMHIHVFRKEKAMRSFRRLLILCLTVGAMGRSTLPALATPFASNVTKVGSTVSLILNEPTDTLKYSIN